MPILQSAFGTTAAGATIDCYTLRNAHGLEAVVITYGGVLTHLRTPDRSGIMGDVVLGFDALEPYEGEHPYFGSLIGRYGNRIANGQFVLNGSTYTLARNNGPNHLHGGPRGFHRAVWNATAHEPAGDPSLALMYTSVDGEEGYPGNLHASVTYTLTNQNELRIDYRATTDQDTHINLTNHSYFNLAGGGDILGHHLRLSASRFVPISDTLIPLGELRAVHGTPMDFSVATTIGARIDAHDEQLGVAGGYDHCWVLDGDAGMLRLVGDVYEPTSGRVMEVYTTQPGVQFYSGNFLDGSLTGKNGQVYAHRTGLCLETQHFPDTPNQPQFPSTLLRVDETYQQTTVYRFAVR